MICPHQTGHFGGVGAPSLVRKPLTLPADRKLKQQGLQLFQVAAQGHLHCLANFCGRKPAETGPSWQNAPRSAMEVKLKWTSMALPQCPVIRRKSCSTLFFTHDIDSPSLAHRGRAKTDCCCLALTECSTGQSHPNA